MVRANARGFQDGSKRHFIAQSLRTDVNYYVFHFSRPLKNPQKPSEPLILLWAVLIANYIDMAGMTISLTAVLQFANDEAWKNKIAHEVFSGKKKICLAITEAFAGSDVAGLRTTAKKTKDGKHYIVNGTKKW